MNEVLIGLAILGVVVLVVGIVLHSKIDAVHQAALAPVTVALVPAAPAQAAAPAPPHAPKETQPDSVVFDPGAYPDAGQRAAAAQALVASLRAKWGNTLTKVVSPRGYEIDVRGDEMLPDTGPSIDDLTAADPLDFAKVGGGVPIPLPALHKTVVGCPPKVMVRVFLISGDSSAPAVCTGSVNGNPFHFGTSIVYDTNQMGLTINGPDVVVKVDQPGMQFNIQQVA